MPKRRAAGALGYDGVVTLWARAGTRFPTGTRTEELLAGLRAALSPPTGWGMTPALAGGPLVAMARGTDAPIRHGLPPGTAASSLTYGGGRDPDAPASVESMVAGAQAGDPEAFGELYDRYAGIVYRYLYFRMADRALAEDLTSETFIRALRRITSFTWQGRDFGAWLITIARNLVADHYKSGRYRLEVTTADLFGAGADRTTEGPEREVLAALTNEALLTAVRQLGPDQQECIVLRFLQDLSVAETALVMGKNEGAIKALQYRAVRALSRLLPEGFLP